MNYFKITLKSLISALILYLIWATINGFTEGQFFHLNVDDIIKIALIFIIDFIFLVVVENKK